MKNFRLLSFVLLIGLASLSVFAQAENTDETKPCYQNESEKLRIIKEAEQGQFRVRRLEISGNTYTRHRVFVEKMFFNEGNLFTQSDLSKTIKGISKIRTIYPIDLEDVEVRLDRNFKDIDIVFCVIQKKKN